MFNSLLNKIINTKVGKINFWLASFGMFFAILLILLAVMVRSNFSSLSQNKSNYVVINKKISNEMMKDITQSAFKKNEIDELLKTEFFDSIEGIKASLYKVKLKVPVNTIPLSTDMFFLSVPDQYLDVIPNDWSWKPGDKSLKGIAPRFLLDMYNYGFAVGQQTPQLSEATISVIPLNFYISNEDESKIVMFEGNIGALSSRFNGIMVPESFMNWANDSLGFLKSKDPVGLVAKVKNPNDKNLIEFLALKNYKLDEGRYGAFAPYVKWVTNITKYSGILYLAFALLVILMFIQLTITSARNEVQLLKTLGTSPRQLENFLMKRFMPIYIYLLGSIILILSCIQLWLGTSKRIQKEELVFNKTLPLEVFVTAAIILLILYFVNKYTIKKRVNN